MPYQVMGKHLFFYIVSSLVGNFRGKKKQRGEEEKGGGEERRRWRGE
jgi:hypothetical protein